MLTGEQLSFYHENGYVLVERMFTPAEAEALRRECHELAARLSAERNIDATWGSARGDGAGQDDGRAPLSRCAVLLSRVQPVDCR